MCLSHVIPTGSSVCCWTLHKLRYVIKCMVCSVGCCSWASPLYRSLLLWWHVRNCAAHIFGAVVERANVVGCADLQIEHSL